MGTGTKGGLVYEEQASTYRLELPLRQKLPTKPGKERVLVLSGPTGVGKTAMSLKIAEVLGGEIISADSMQVYRGMDIGTNKVGSTDRARIPHHMIDIRDLHEGFNVKEFFEEAMDKVRAILLRGHVPIIVGGTGFYLHALLYGPPGGPPSSPTVRARLEKELEEQGEQKLYERLKSADPDYAARISARDRQKLIRALEIIEVTAQKVSAISNVTPPIDYDFRCWFLYLPRDLLYRVLEERCEEMINAGFIDEVKRLEEAGLRKNQPASLAIGYRQCLDFFQSKQGEQDYLDFVKHFKQSTRRYAKRQFTWFRKEPLFRWVDVASLPRETLIEMILQDFEVGH